MTDDMPVSAEVLDALGRLDTPTVCNALEVVIPDRRGWGYTTRPLVCARPDLPAIVGFARTATMAAAHPSGHSGPDDRDWRVAYYRYMDEGPKPAITVIEDLDDPPGFGAWWGEVHTNVHQGLGSRGVITNGSIRDLPDNADGFQLIAGSVGPSHAFNHGIEVGVTVTIHGMVVRHGDLIHADQHGAVVIPPEVAADVPAAATAIAAREKVLIEAAQEPGFGWQDVARIIGGSSEAH
ncbi:MAG: RraA family protein [Actinomycetia bacterium]|nr:RraA family protein [Actinomycetes bacterium]